VFPVSIKGVLFPQPGRCILAMNDREEWELPGGRIEIGESPEACLAREFLEELSLRVTVGPLLDSHLFEVIPGRHVFIVTYGCRLDGPFAPVISDEHTRCEVFALDALPANLPAGYRRSIEAWNDR
jgi:8-oxo-dGTP pyrophosphatase MutT (NUDIX family)